MSYPQILRTGWGYRCGGCQSVLVGPKKHVVICYGYLVLVVLFCLHMFVIALLGFDRIFVWAQSLGVNDRSAFVAIAQAYLYLWVGIWAILTALNLRSLRRIALRVENGGDMSNASDTQTDRLPHH